MFKVFLQIILSLLLTSTFTLSLCKAAEPYENDLSLSNQYSNANEVDKDKVNMVMREIEFRIANQTFKNNYDWLMVSDFDAENHVLLPDVKKVYKGIKSLIENNLNQNEIESLGKLLLERYSYQGFDKVSRDATHIASRTVVFTAIVLGIIVSMVLSGFVKEQWAFESTKNVTQLLFALSGSGLTLWIAIKKFSAMSQKNTIPKILEKIGNNCLGAFGSKAQSY